MELCSHLKERAPKETMSFFTEQQDDKNFILFCKGSPTSYQEYLGAYGTFFPELVAKNGDKYPAWVFENAQGQFIERFLSSQDEEGSQQSEADISEFLSEICDRLDDLDKSVHALTVEMHDLGKRLTAVEKATHKRRS